jgi:Tfp pilus assembly protein PilO
MGANNRVTRKVVNVASVHHLESQIEEMSKKLDKLYLALVGDKEMGQVGIVEKVEKHEKFIEQHKLQDAKVVGITAAISFVFGFVVEFWGKIFR